MFTEEQKELIIDVVQQTADGLFAKGEMVRKLEAICKQADPNARFEDDGVFGTAADAEAEALAILTNTSVMAVRP